MERARQWLKGEIFAPPSATPQTNLFSAIATLFYLTFPVLEEGPPQLYYQKVPFEHAYADETHRQSHGCPRAVRRCWPLPVLHLSTRGLYCNSTEVSVTTKHLHAVVAVLHATDSRYDLIESTMA